MSLSALWVWWAGVSVGRPAAWSLQEGTVESRETTSASLSFRRRREGGTWKERPSSIHNIYQKSRKEKCIVQQRNGRNRYQGCLIKNEWDKSGEGIKSHKSQTMFPNFKKDPSVHAYTHIDTLVHTLVLPSGIIQRSGQNSSPLIMQMNMTLAGLGTRSHQHPYPA